MSYTEFSLPLKEKQKHMQNITIFCSASDTVAPIYKNEAETVGQWIGTHHKTLVYGGANGGLMEIVAKEVRDNGSQVLGIITRHIAEMGRSSQQPTDLVTTDSMGERKRLLIERGDILVALPGGIGTIDELFDALTTKMLGTHDKPVIICNTQGLFNPLIQQIELLRKENFLRYDRPDLYHIVPDAKTCCELLERYNR
ncbi:MAG TPA: TIGR00730 family Rossman fold protein [Barnesiella sp.]|nr:TIGR00730 family Rossman fold protein [Barnesiella sp.]